MAEAPGPTRQPTRRAVMWGVPALVTAGFISASSIPPRPRARQIGLHCETVALSDAHRRVPVATVAELVRPDSRVLLGSAQEDELTRREASIVTSSEGLAGYGRFSEAARLALLDLRVLTLRNGASVAGWSRSWKYVWPRDAAFIAAAYSSTGHGDLARNILGFLQDVQPEDGVFQARYLPDRSGRVPDRRGVQGDGMGWALWGLLQWARSLPGADRRAQLAELMPLLTRSAAAAAQLTAGGTALPPASADYWELRETDVTLGTAALALIGLESARDLYWIAGLRDHARNYSVAVTRYREVIRREFAPRGYARYRNRDDMDTAVTFLLPPFTQTADDDVIDAWQRARTSLRRPGGGLAPGAGWPADGISWTPETAMFALTGAASGRAEDAAAELDWLDGHRTSAGSFSEKVLADGSPAAVAPLAWTAASFLLALAHGGAHST